MLHITLEGNGAKGAMQTHILSLHAPSTPGVGSKIKALFSESNHVAYQIKGNGAKNHASTHYVLTHTNLTCGMN